MAFSSIPAASIAVGKAIKKSLMQLISDNLDDLDSRISALSASANKISVFEYNVDPKDLHIGEIMAADLTLAEFQAVHGTGWIIADGSSCTGSVYASVTGHTIVPDLRDEFLRGASGTFTLGTAYADSTAKNGLNATVDNDSHAHTNSVGNQSANHTHTGTTSSNGSHTHGQNARTSTTTQALQYENAGGGSGQALVPTATAGSGGLVPVITASSGAHTHTMTTGTISASHIHTVTVNSDTHNHNLTWSEDSETRPQNYAVNFFIKINLSAQDCLMSIVAKEDMTIVSVQGYIIDKHGLPTSGSFEFDIKKASTRAGLTTVFTTKPSLAYSGGIADGDNTSSGTFIGGGANVSQGDFLDLDITGMMPGQSGFIISVYAEPA